MFKISWSVWLAFLFTNHFLCISVLPVEPWPTEPVEEGRTRLGPQISWMALWKDGFVCMWCDGFHLSASKSPNAALRTGVWFWKKWTRSCHLLVFPWSGQGWKYCFIKKKRWMRKCPIVAVTFEGPSWIRSWNRGPCKLSTRRYSTDDAKTVQPHPGPAGPARFSSADSGIQGEPQWSSGDREGRIGTALWATLGTGHVQLPLRRRHKWVCAYLHGRHVQPTCKN